jgi:hypothetical protein
MKGAREGPQRTRVLDPPRKGPWRALLLAVGLGFSGARQLAQSGSSNGDIRTTSPATSPPPWLVHTPRDLVLGLADHAATDLLVLQDVVLQPSDFAGRLPSPVAILRNVTIRCGRLFFPRFQASLPSRGPALPHIVQST